MSAKIVEKYVKDTMAVFKFKEDETEREAFGGEKFFKHEYNGQRPYLKSNDGRVITEYISTVLTLKYGRKKGQSELSSFDIANEIQSIRLTVGKYENFSQVGILRVELGEVAPPELNGSTYTVEINIDFYVNYTF